MKLNELSGWLRLSLLVSVVYLVIIFISSVDSGDFYYDQFISYGILPVLLCWGVWWVYKGFKKHRKTTAVHQNKKSNTNSINEAKSSNSNSSKAAENKSLKESKPSVEQKKFSSKEVYFKWKESRINSIKVLWEGDRKQLKLWFLIYLFFWLGGGATWILASSNSVKLLLVVAKIGKGMFFCSIFPYIISLIYVYKIQKKLYELKLDKHSPGRVIFYGFLINPYGAGFYIPARVLVKSRSIKKNLEAQLKSV